MKNLLFITIFGLSVFSCKNEQKINKETRTQIEIITTQGNILVELYNETPKHRDNFIKLVKSGFYDSILFHRVIDDFIIQTGDPTSKTATLQDTLGSESVGYNIPSEIIDTIFHKRGTLSAAHDGNPDFYSDGSHFVIVQMGPVPDSVFIKMEDWINEHLNIYNTYHADSNAALYTTTMEAYNNKNDSLYYKLSDSVSNLASQVENPDLFHFPEEHKAYYMKHGGAPFNDRLFTVFGEVVTGMDVVDSIAITNTDENDRPLTDVRIISMRIVKDGMKK